MTEEPIAPATAAVPVVAWFVPAAALLSLSGAVVPWFRPESSGNGGEVFPSTAVHVWQAGWVGLLAPVLLFAVAVPAVGLLTGSLDPRFARGRDATVVIGAAAALAGVLSAVAVYGAWLLLPHVYTFSGFSWDRVDGVLANLGRSLSRGPQLGFFLTSVAAALAFAGGVLMLVSGQIERRAASS